MVATLPQQASNLYQYEQWSRDTEQNSEAVPHEMAIRQVSRWINDSSPQRIFACSLVTVNFL